MRGPASSSTMQHASAADGSSLLGLLIAPTGMLLPRQLSRHRNVSQRRFCTVKKRARPLGLRKHGIRSVAVSVCPKAIYPVRLTISGPSKHRSHNLDTPLERAVRDFPGVTGIDGIYCVRWNASN
jgi:hypothetical protein